LALFANKENHVYAHYQKVSQKMLREHNRTITFIRPLYFVGSKKVKIHYTVLGS